MAAYQYYERSYSNDPRSLLARVDVDSSPLNAQGFFWQHNEWRDYNKPGFASKLMFDPATDWDPISESEASALTGGVL